MYDWLVIRKVELSNGAIKDLASIPDHVAVKLQDWVEDVEDRGLEVVRNVPGYHDEPLKGRLKGLRSIRLSRAYRAYYRIVGSVVEFIQVEGIDKHDY